MNASLPFVHTARRCYRLGFTVTGSEVVVPRLLSGRWVLQPKFKLLYGLEEAEVVTR
jgi:hypothetical protein